MKHFSLIKTSTFALAIAATIALSSNESQAQFSFHGPNGGGIDIGRYGSVNIHSGGNQYRGSRYSNVGGSNFGGSNYRSTNYRSTNYRSTNYRGTNYGSNYGSGNGYGSRYASSNFGGSYGVRRAPAHTWHDTSHYDYHPAQAVRHGNHYDVQPAHFDLHRTGHVDHNHR